MRFLTHALGGFLFLLSLSSSFSAANQTLSVSELEILQQQLQEMKQENHQLHQHIGRQERQIHRHKNREKDYRRLVGELDELSDDLQRRLRSLYTQMPKVLNKHSKNQPIAQDSPEPVERFLTSLDLWLDELENSSRLSTWQGWLDERQMSFIRLGRIGLYSLTPDKTEAAMYQKESGQWRQLSLIETQEVSRARDMAAGSRRADWLYLPIAGKVQGEE